MGLPPHCTPGLNILPALNTCNEKRNHKIPSFQLKPPQGLSPGLQWQRQGLYWGMATGQKHQCGGNPPLWAELTNWCHVVTGGHQEPGVLLFFWMSPARSGKEEEATIFIQTGFSYLIYVIKTPKGFICCSNQTAAKIQSTVVTQKGDKPKQKKRKRRKNKLRKESQSCTWCIANCTI